MAVRSSLSLRGMYEYDRGLFTGINLPDEVDYVDFIYLLLTETEDLEVVYPDPTFMKDAIRFWGRLMRPSWEAMAKALYAKYNPIENYNREESWTDSGSRTDNLTEVNSGSMTGSGSVSETTGGTTINSKRGYNSAGWIAGEKDESTGSISNTTTDSTTNSNTRTNTGTVGTSNTRTGNVHGNIGVTSSQQMITQEVELRVKHQLCNIIIQQFKMKFCLLVY